MKPLFEEHEGQLFRMLDKPVPLTENTQFPCLVRMIQDGSPMGKYNNDMNCWDIIKDMLWITRNIKENPFYSNTLHAYKKDSNGQDSCIASIHQLEIIGYPVEEGSNDWALYQMMQGKKVSPKSAIGNVYWALNQDGDVQYYDMDNLACIGLIRDKLEFWKKDVAKTGWQIYKEPKPEPEQPKYKVGDWVEMDYKGTLYHRQVISVHDNGIRVEFGSATPLISFDGKSSMLLIRLVRKLKPNEVEVPINISGTVRQAYNEDGTIDDEQFQLLPNGSWDGTEMFISFDALDSHTRKLVESLLKAQEEEK